jgi:hypothetical protein
MLSTHGFQQWGFFFTLTPTVTWDLSLYGFIWRTGRPRPTVGFKPGTQRSDDLCTSTLTIAPHGRLLMDEKSIKWIHLVKELQFRINGVSCYIAVNLQVAWKCPLNSDWLSQKGPCQRFQNWYWFFLSHKKIRWSRAFTECVLHVLWPRLKFLKRKSKIRGSKSWYQMKGLARRNTREIWKPY